MARRDAITSQSVHALLQRRDLGTDNSIKGRIRWFIATTRLLHNSEEMSHGLRQTTTESTFPILSTLFLETPASHAAPLPVSVSTPAAAKAAKSG